MNVLSLFDGMSCGQIALRKTGINISCYVASEIDKQAIKVTQTNFPNTIQIGDVCSVHVTNIGVEVDLPDGQLRSIDCGKIDLLLAGSPCQGFSNAGKRLNFDDPRSKLFFEFVRIWNEVKLCNPNAKFLLENVDMLQEWQDIISKQVGVIPIKINSALVSAQNRVRLYWTNIGVKEDMYGHMIPGIPQPKDQGIVLRDILQDDVDEKFYLTEKSLARIAGMSTVKNGFRPYQGDARKSGISELGTLSNADCQSDAILASHTPKLISDRGIGRSLKLEGNKVPPLRSSNGCSHDNRVIIPGTINHNVFIEKGDKSLNIDANYFKGPDNHGQRTVIQVNRSIESGGKQPYQQNRVYDPDGKSPALMSLLSTGAHAITHLDKNYKDKDKDKANTLVSTMHKGSQANGQSLFDFNSSIRRLTPVECERLQGVPDNYTDSVSDTQRYKMLGNGWQVDTIVHLLKFLK